MYTSNLRIIRNHFSIVSGYAVNKIFIEGSCFCTIDYIINDVDLIISIDFVFDSVVYIHKRKIIFYGFNNFAKTICYK